MNDFLGALSGAVSWNVLIVLAGFFAFYALGQFCLDRICRRPIRRGGFLVPLVLGMDLAALIALILGGFFAALPEGVLPLLLGGGGAVGVWMLACRNWRAGALAYWRGNRLFLIFLFLLLAGGVGSALIPPQAWDEQTYQLALPVRWLQVGSVAATPDNPYSAFPLLPQFVMLWVIAGGGLGAAKIFMLAVYGLLLLAAYEELRRLGGRVTALILVVLFVASPLVMVMGRSTYVEPFIVLQLLAALRLRRMRVGRNAGILFGIFAASAAAVKLTALGAALLIAVWGGQGKRRELRCYLPRLIFAGAIFTLAFYLRAWIATGNPVYPFGTAVFGGNVEVEAYHHSMGSFYYGLGAGVFGISLSWLFAGFDELIYDGIVMGYAWIGLVALCFGGSFLLIRRGVKRRELWFWGGSWLLLYLFWCFTSQQTRFLLPAFLVLLCWGAVVIAALPLNWRKLLLLLFLFCAAIGVERTAVQHYFYAWKFSSAARSNPTPFLKHVLREPEFVNTLEVLDRTAPKDARVLLLFERRSLYVPRVSFNGTPGFQDWIFSPLPESIDDMMNALQERGIDYILVGASPRNPDHLEAYNQINAKLAYRLEVLLKNHLLEVVPVSDGGAYVLLKVVKKR